MKYIWLFCVFIGGIVGFNKINSANPAEVMVPMGLFGGLIFGGIIQAIVNSLSQTETARDLSNLYAKKQEEIEIKKDVKKEEGKYQDAKNSFKYLSDGRLEEKYKYFKAQNRKDIVLLALEEEMVNRGLLDYSPAHEKLDSIRDVFTSNAEIRNTDSDSIIENKFSQLLTNERIAIVNLTSVFIATHGSKIEGREFINVLLSRFSLSFQQCINRKELGPDQMVKDLSGLSWEYKEYLVLFINDVIKSYVMASEETVNKMLGIFERIGLDSDSTIEIVKKYRT